LGIRRVLHLLLGLGIRRVLHLLLRLGIRRMLLRLRLSYPLMRRPSLLLDQRQRLRLIRLLPPPVPHHLSEELLSDYRQAIPCNRLVRCRLLVPLSPPLVGRRPLDRRLLPTRLFPSRATRRPLPISHLLLVRLLLPLAVLQWYLVADKPLRPTRLGLHRPWFPMAAFQVPWEEGPRRLRLPEASPWVPPTRKSAVSSEPSAPCARESHCMAGVHFAAVKN
jgi:hypothetical protein